MVSVVQLKNGSWFVTWNTGLSCSKLISEVVFTCHQANFTMGSSQLGKRISLHLKQNGNQRLGEENRLMVAAVYNNQLKDMKEHPLGHWGPAFWESFHSFSLSQSPVFQVMIDYRKSDAKPAITEGQQQVLTHLSTLLDTQSMADVEFVVKGHEIKAHSAIVASASPVMAAMFEAGKFKESLTRKVQVEDMEPSTFRQMLRYLYTGEVPKMEHTTTCEMLFLAADKYQIEALKKVCEHILIGSLSLKNAVHLLVLADLHSAAKLLEGSMLCLKRNKKVIWGRPEWKQLMSNFPDLFFRASQRIFG